MTDVVVFIARAGSGKTTAARYLEREFDFTRLSFAGALKRVARDVMGFGDQQLYGPNSVKEAVDPRYGMSPRTFLQELGCAMREHVGPDVWVRGVIHEIASRPGGRFVIDDCRFPNELAALQRAADRGEFRLLAIGIVSGCPSTQDDGSHESERHINSMLDEVPCITNPMNGMQYFEKVLRTVMSVSGLEISTDSRQTSN